MRVPERPESFLIGSHYQGRIQKGAKGGAGVLCSFSTSVMKKRIYCNISDAVLEDAKEDNIIIYAIIAPLIFHVDEKPKQTTAMAQSY